MTFLPRLSSDANGEPMDSLSAADVAVLSTTLLAWWERHGRGDIPWKLLPGGGRPAPHQQLDPYGIWIAEVMLQFPAHCFGFGGDALNSKCAY